MRRVRKITPQLDKIQRAWERASQQEDPLEHLAALHEILPLLDELRRTVVSQRAKAMVECYDALKARGNGTYKVIQARLGISKGLIDQIVNAGRGTPVVPWRKRKASVHQD